MEVNYTPLDLGGLEIHGNMVTPHGSDVSYQFRAADVFALLGEPAPEIYKASKSDPDTMTLQQALADVENRDRWIEALEKEIRALEAHGVWELKKCQSRKPQETSHLVIS